MNFSKLLSIAMMLLSFFPAKASAQIKLAEEFKMKVGRLARLEAVCDTPVKWLNLHDDLDVIPDSSGKFVTLLAAKAGRFKIAAYTSGKDGPSEPAYCIVVADGPGGAPAPGVPPKGTADPVAATGRIRFGNAGCTATVMYPRRADGKWDVLTAAHCTGNAGAKGTLTLKDGRTIPLTVAVRKTGADICWLVTDSADHSDLPFAMMATADPVAGTAIWHNGYGVDRPQNKETGTVAGGPDGNGQLKMTLSVSSGDSGGGIFRADNGELIAVVCCTSAMAKIGSMWGGSATTAAKLRPKTSVEFEQSPDCEFDDDIHRRSLELMHPIEILPIGYEG